MRVFEDGATYATPTLWLNDDGTIWLGPINPLSNLHFAKFSGMDDGNDPIWILRSSECPVGCRKVNI